MYILNNNIMDVRFKEKSKIVDIAIVCVGVFVSVGTMLYGIFHFGLKETWPELILNLFYIACLVMIVMYFFQKGITSNQFNYWCSLCVGVTILLRDILFPPPLTSYPLHLACLTLAVMLLLMLTYFYARKEWKTYSKLNLWMICIIDMILAGIYTYIRSLPTNSPPIRSLKSGFAPPSPTDWWPASSKQQKRNLNLES